MPNSLILILETSKEFCITKEFIEEMVKIPGIIIRGNTILCDNEESSYQVCNLFSKYKDRELINDDEDELSDEEQCNLLDKLEDEIWGYSKKLIPEIEDIHRTINFIDTAINVSNLHPYFDMNQERFEAYTKLIIQPMQIVLDIILEHNSIDWDKRKVYFMDFLNELQRIIDRYRQTVNNH